MGRGLCVSLLNDNDNEVGSGKIKFLKMKVVSPGRYRSLFSARVLWETGTSYPKEYVFLGDPSPKLDV